MTLSHQNLAQITNQTLKSAVLANARSRLLFSTGDEDASVFVKNDPRLSAEDVVGLSSYEAYASLLSSNQSQPYASVMTLPPPPAVNDPKRSGNAPPSVGVNRLAKSMPPSRHSSA